MPRKIITGLAIAITAWAALIGAAIVWAINRDVEASAIRTVKRAMGGAT